MSDHLYYIVQVEKTHHKFASGVHELFLEFFHLLLRSPSNSEVHLFVWDVRHNTVLLAKYESHQFIMCPFANFVDQVPEYDLVNISASDQRDFQYLVICKSSQAFRDSRPPFSPNTSAR